MDTPALKDLLRTSSAELQQAEPHSSARLDVELLLCAALEQKRSYLFSHSNEILSTEHSARFAALWQRRQSGEPVAYILGEQEFWSLPLKVSPGCLIPRPETELLVEFALAQQPEPARLLDLGCGSGAIALALASEKPHWSIVASDASESALRITQENADNLQLRIEYLHSDWFETIPGQFDGILSNPPYVAEGDPHLQHLSHEPDSALTSGNDGLDDIRLIVEQAPDKLNPGGWLALEHGKDQAADIRELLASRGFQQVATQQDLAGLDRITYGYWA